MINCQTCLLTSPQWEGGTGHTPSSLLSGSRERPGVYPMILEPHSTSPLCLSARLPQIFSLSGSAVAKLYK